MKIYQDIDFETKVASLEDEIPVRVEASVSVYFPSRVCEIERVKVILLDTDTEWLLSDQQMKDIYEEIHERFEPDEPGADWRNEWA